MNEGYTKVFSLEENLYLGGAPVIIRSGALYKDDNSSEVFAKLNIQSLSDKKIKAMKVEITYFDTMCRLLGEPFVVYYLDFTAGRGEYLLPSYKIKFPYNTVRVFSAKVIEVGFVDNSIWSPSIGEWKQDVTKNDLSDPHNGFTSWESIGAPKSSASIITDPLAYKGYKSIYGEGANYAAFYAGEVWGCTCGEINNAGEECCYNCGAKIKELLNLDVEELRKEEIYRAATALLEFDAQENLNKAIEELEKIKDYKDSAERIEKAKANLAVKESAKKAKKKKAIKLSTIIGGSIVVLALLGYFAIYPLVAFLSGDYKVYINMYNVEEFTVPSGTTSIGYEAFSGYDSLTSITIPDGVTNIGDYAFSDCTSLTSITIPDSVTSIGDYAFSDCTSLTSITIPDSVTSIGDCAFWGCDSLTSITIPDSVTSIGEGAFQFCDSLTSITIPDSVTSIGDKVFYSCESLTSLTIPDSVTSIGEDAFRSCDSLTSIEIPDGVTSIGDGAFYGCVSLTSITIPDSVTSIGDCAFWGCDSLTSITLPDSVTSIGDFAFYSCESLKSITIPDSVTSIGYSAFLNCTSLTDVYYEGTSGEFKNIKISTGNSAFEDANIHYMQN